MSLAADDIIDRRHLRRKVSFWRILTFLVIAALLISLFFALGFGKTLGSRNADHIARVNIDGTITNDKPMIDLLEELQKNDRVKGVIIGVSSPGGTTVGGEAIFEAVRELADKKPTTASVGTLAASAGYMIASATDHIVARRSSIVGSIGVIFQFGNVTELLNKVGVKMEEVKSSPLKAEPSPFNETTEEEKAVLSKLVDDSYNWFVDLVAERRKLDRQKVLKLADGSIYSGGQGLENGLVDAIGGEKIAKKWLVEERDLSDNLEVIEWNPVRPGDTIFAGNALIGWLANQLGFPSGPHTIDSIGNILPERLFLDGLLSVWVNSDGGQKGNRND